MKSLEDQLNEAADTELHKMVEAALLPLSQFPSAGFINLNSELKNSEDEKQPSIGDYVVALRDHVFHGFRDAYREEFREHLIRKMQDTAASLESVSPDTIRGLYLAVVRVRGVDFANKIFQDFKAKASAESTKGMTQEERSLLADNLISGIRFGSVPPEFQEQH